MRRLGFLLVSLAFVTPAVLSAESMRCELLEVFELSSNGVLVANGLADAYRQDDMVIDMTTGTIYHHGFGNEHYPIKQILDRGSQSSSFKLISSSIPNPVSDLEGELFVNTVSLQIDTWAEGESKPFIVFEGPNVGTGLCQ